MRLIEEWDRNWDREVERVSRLRTAGKEMLKVSLENPSIPDGYPSRSLGDGTAPSTNDSTSTERAALAEFPDDDPDKPGPHPTADERIQHVDWVNKLVAEFFAQDVVARTALSKMERLHRLVSNRAEHKERMERKDGRCRACQKEVEGTAEDRLRTGLCNSCYTAWLRWRAPVLDVTGDANMAHFLSGRQAELGIDAEGRCVECGRSKEAVDHDSRCVEMRRLKAC